MKILTRKYKVKANINHVFFCFTDIDYIHKEFNRLAKGEGIRSVKNNLELEIKGKKSLFKLKAVEEEAPNYFEAEITPTSKQLMKFGGVVIICNFLFHGEYTKVTTKVISNKNPSLLWKLFIKIIASILVFQSIKNEKRFIQAIEKSA